MPTEIRSCPLCGGANAGKAFPYSVTYQALLFAYWKCSKCSTVYVDPIPDAKTFASMYSKNDYHDVFYSLCNSSRLQDSIDLLLSLDPNTGTILDYGCGIGQFLNLAKLHGFEPTGVEFDEKAAQQASEFVGCRVDTPDVFFSGKRITKYDVIHIGDVLEHLPDPHLIVKQLITHLKLGGILYVEGPLELNSSPVYWASLIFGVLKRRLTPFYVGEGVPHHLYRTGSEQQKSFFARIDSRLNVKAWEIYETGWPYSDGGFIKKLIAKLATSIGGRRILNTTFGNRFRGVFILEQ